jgi:hypothetical protein
MLLSASALVLVGAGFSRSPGLDRLSSIPRSEREKLWENLARFDRLPPAQQAAIRELDRRLRELDDPAQRDRYFQVLRDYHVWASRLPSEKRDRLRKGPVDDRMALVQRFWSESEPLQRPLPLVLQIVDVGDTSPRELATIYRLWTKLTPAERSQLEQVPLARRSAQLATLAKTHEVSTEVDLPPEFDEAEWVRTLRARLREERKNGPEEDAWINKIQSRKAARALPQSKQLANGNSPEDRYAELRPEIFRRMALNLYFLEHPPARVSPDRLEQFVAGLPTWALAGFDAFPPAEARRRIAVVYRLLFPAPAEIPSAGHSPAGQPVPSSTPPTTPRPGPSVPANANPSPAAPAAIPPKAAPQPATSGSPF